MDLIIISSPKPVSQESEIINQLFDSGLQKFHLRKPESGKQEVKSILEEISIQHHSKIVLHNHYELSEKYDIRGNHFSKNNLSIFPKKQLSYLSTSFHSIEKLIYNDYPFEYVFLSPVFTSISKPGYQKEFDLDRLSQYLNNIKKRPKVIALGGIDENTIFEAKKVGFDGVAILGSIWNKAENIKESIDFFKEMQNICLEINTVTQ